MNRKRVFQLINETRILLDKIEAEVSSPEGYHPINVTYEDVLEYIHTQPNAEEGL